MAATMSADKTGRQFDLAAQEGDPDKNRSEHIRSLVADRLKEEDARKQLVAREIIKMKRAGPHSASITTPQLDLAYPITTNQETHNNE